MYPAGASAGGRARAARPAPAGHAGATIGALSKSLAGLPQHLCMFCGGGVRPSGPVLDSSGPASPLLGQQPYASCAPFSLAPRLQVPIRINALHLAPGGCPTFGSCCCAFGRSHVASRQVWWQSTRPVMSEYIHP